MLAPLLVLAALSSPVAPAPVNVSLQPLGVVDRTMLASLVTSLESSLRVRVAILPPQPLPASAFYPPRARYRAAELVSYLERSTPPGAGIVLGVTRRDISVTKGTVADWGVFGVARRSGRAGVVSTSRLSGGVSQARLLARLGRVASHEIAHALGLVHCDTPGCLMNDAGGSVRSVDEATGFCARCRAQLAAAAAL